MSIIEEDDWVRDGDTSVFIRSVPLNSPLGQFVLNDLAIRYPQFKPKYINQIREYECAPFDMVDATVIGPEDTIMTILDENGLPRPQEYHKDIASVTYALAGKALSFGQMYTFYDLATQKEPEIRPDLREFYETYQQLKKNNPHTVAAIEGFATLYERKLFEHGGIYDPLALRELLWHFLSV